MNKYVIYTIGNGVRISYTVSETSLVDAKEKVNFYLSIKHLTKHFNDDFEVDVYGGKRIK